MIILVQNMSKTESLCSEESVFTEGSKVVSGFRKLVTCLIQTLGILDGFSEATTLWSHEGHRKILVLIRCSGLLEKIDSITRSSKLALIKWVSITIGVVQTLLVSAYN
jgi:hypothetical protein